LRGLVAATAQILIEMITWQPLRCTNSLRRRY
jgi:hypothetical protein